MTRTTALASLLVLYSMACSSPSSEPEPLPPAEPSLQNGSFTAELNGFRIHYEIHGTGLVLMTVPNAWGLSLEGLRGLYRPLEEYLTMVYFDPRGMGGSDPVKVKEDRGTGAIRADFDALREHLRLDRVSAIGWSNGASNLILLAGDHPESITSAVFVHGVASFAEEDVQSMGERYRELFRQFGEFNQQMADPELTETERNARVKDFDIQTWFPQMLADREAHAARLAEAFQDAEFSWAHAQYVNEEWPTLDLRDRLAEIRARSLVLTGEHDMLPVAKGKELAEGIPDARFVVFERSGHFAPLEEPEKFVTTVVDFLNAER